MKEEFDSFANGNLSESPLYEEAHGTQKDFIPFRPLIIVLLILYLILLPASFYFKQNYIRTVVSGDSMKSTLLDGETLYVALNEEAERGDIVVVNVAAYKEGYSFSGDYIVKRLIATEGDTIYCQRNQVYIRYAGTQEDVPLSEEYLDVTAVTADFPPVTVGTDEVFVMGDNRAASYDSRRTGCFKETEVFGVIPDWSYEMKGFFTFWYNLGKEKK